MEINNIYIMMQPILTAAATSKGNGSFHYRIEPSG
jgi:hypothetical protein